ncbi:hypothetical protein ACFSTC_40300 [Nonomuraea ferruginea]
MAGSTTARGVASDGLVNRLRFLALTSGLAVLGPPAAGRSGAAQGQRDPDRPGDPRDATAAGAAEHHGLATPPGPR